MQLKRLIKRMWQMWQVRRDPVAYARSLGVRVGEGTQIFSTELGIFGGEPYLVTLGRCCYVTEGVRFVTHDGGVLLFRNEIPDLELVLPITLGDNVYVGMRSILLPGTRVGSNCVIGAGAVVRGELPGNTVVAGVPARVIKPLSEYRAGLLARSMRVGSLNPDVRRETFERRFFLR